jgi:GDP-4-dehydro-6-deoxy-D-mannose reductase
MAIYERILLTGASGFVGSHLAPALARAYPEARRVAMAAPGDARCMADWEIARADLTDEAQIERLVAQTVPDLVVHLAGMASPHLARQDRAGVRRVNARGCEHLASALSRHAPGSTVLFASSASVYDWSKLAGDAATEDAPLRSADTEDDDPYAASKVVAEDVLAKTLDASAKLVIARPTNHSGWGQKDRNFPLARFAERIVEIENGQVEPIIEHGDLDAGRDFLDVRDVVDAYLRLIALAPTLPAGTSVFNVGSGKAHRIGDLLERLRGMTRAETATRRDSNFGKAAIRSMVCDASRLRRATGWAPHYSIDEMLQSLLDFWRRETASSWDAAQ